MKKKTLHISKKLLLNKDLITTLNQQAQRAIEGGISGKACPPLSGTGCGCLMDTCGIVVCTAAGCAADDDLSLAR